WESEPCDELLCISAFPPPIRLRPIRSASCARSPGVWAVRSSRSTGTTALAALRAVTGAPRSISCAVTLTDGNSTWSWLGRSTGWVTACRIWSASCPSSRAEDRLIPAPTGPRHHDARRQGDLSDDGRFRRVRTGDDSRTSPCRACQGQERE